MFPYSGPNFSTPSEAEERLGDALRDPNATYADLRAVGSRFVSVGGHNRAARIDRLRKLVYERAQHLAASHPHPKGGDGEAAERNIALAAPMVRRVEKEGFGRNAASTVENITSRLARADANLGLREESGEDVTKLSERFWKLYDRAALAGCIRGDYSKLRDAETRKGKLRAERVRQIAADLGGSAR